MSNVYDTLTMPAEILKRFMDGEWTVSLKSNDNNPDNNNDTLANATIVKGD